MNFKYLFLLLFIIFSTSLAFSNEKETKLQKITKKNGKYFKNEERLKTKYDFINALKPVEEAQIMYKNALKYRKMGTSFVIIGGTFVFLGGVCAMSAIPIFYMVSSTVGFILIYLMPAFLLLAIPAIPLLVHGFKKYNKLKKEAILMYNNEIKKNDDLILYNNFIKIDLFSIKI